MINLYVDDVRECPPGFVVARSVDEAIGILEANEIDILSLDHDMGVDDTESPLPTGYDLVKKICQSNYKIRKIYIHSDNGPGRENMYETLKGAQSREFLSEQLEIYRYPYPPPRQVRKE
ncbi:MAG: cyclic-phosphate processing receiver domain-containing protein [bacterium]